MIIDINEDKTYVDGRFSPLVYKGERYVLVDYENYKGGNMLDILDDFIDFYNSLKEIKNYNGRFLLNFNNTQTSVLSLNRLKKCVISANNIMKKHGRIKLGIIGLTGLQERFANSISMLMTDCSAKTFKEKEDAIKWLIDPTT